jgi:hypothetical protein
MDRWSGGGFAMLVLDYKLRLASRQQMAIDAEIRTS